MSNSLMDKLAVANDLREKEQYGESSKIYTDCLAELINTNDFEGLIHCLGGQSLIYKILSRQNKSKVYRDLTLAFGKISYDIGVEHKDTLDGRTQAIAIRCYADALLMDGKPKEALPYFEEAFSVTTADLPEKGNLKAHIGGIKYLLGEKEEGVRLINESLEDIRTGDMTNSTYLTWETGSLNGLAKIYALEGDKEKALTSVNESLNKAKSGGLSIRTKEAEEILAQITSGNNNFSL